MKIKEEGYRRPQDAQLGISGMRTAEEHNAAEALATADAPVSAPEPYRLVCSSPESERDAIRSLYEAMLDAKQQAGETVSGTFGSFYTFVRRKTTELQREFGCRAVEYTVETQEGQVKLKAKPKSSEYSSVKLPPKSIRLRATRATPQPANAAAQP